MSHTPGPWQIEFATARMHMLSTMHPSPLFEMRPLVGTEDEHKANAKLIAAAPDLLEALQLVVGSLAFDREDETSREVIRRINLALSKATGA